MRFNTEIRSNTLVITKELQEYLSNSDNKIISLEIKPLGNKRTYYQNRFYWKLVQIISDEIGENIEDTHSILRYKFLGQIKKEIYGIELSELPSTQKLSVKEFNVYLENVIKFAKDYLNIKIDYEEYG